MWDYVLDAYSIVNPSCTSNLRPHGIGGRRTAASNQSPDNSMVSEFQSDRSVSVGVSMCVSVCVCGQQFFSLGQYEMKNRYKYE